MRVERSGSLLLLCLEAMLGSFIFSTGVAFIVIAFVFNAHRSQTAHATRRKCPVVGLDRIKTL